jgi:putative tricarboxylic transport membrane protein
MSEIDELPQSGEVAASPSRKVLVGIGVALLGLAALLWLQASGLSAPAIAGVGPAAAQRLVAGLLVLLGVVHLVQAWRKGAQGKSASISVIPVNKQSVFWILGGLMALMMSIALGVGFVLGASALFVATARAFGQAIGGKSIGIALILTLAVYLIFTRGLGLSLPAGLLERLLLS